MNRRGFVKLLGMTAAGTLAHEQLSWLVRQPHSVINLFETFDPFIGFSLHAPAGTGPITFNLWAKPADDPRAMKFYSKTFYEYVEAKEIIVKFGPKGQDLLAKWPMLKADLQKTPHLTNMGIRTVRNHMPAFTHSPGLLLEDSSMNLLSDTELKHAQYLFQPEMKT